MDYSQALKANEILRRQSVHFKDLDIAAQMTQLNSLIKFADNDASASRFALQKLITLRQKRLSLSMLVMVALETEFSVDLEAIEK